MITLPSTLTELNGSIFRGCTDLREITLPKGITTTYWYDFERETGIERINVTDENENLSSIDGVIFNKDKTLLIHYPINRPDDTYTIPDSVTTLSGAVLYSAKNLKHLVFGKNVAYNADGSYGFDGSSFMNGRLESFSVPSENKYYCDIDGVLFTKDKKVLLAYPEKKAGVAYTIPNGTKTLTDWSLSKNEETDMELIYIMLPDSITKIESCAGFIGYYDGLGPNKDIIFFGKKGSIAEKYAKENGLRFGVYNSLSKKPQLLFDCTDLELGKAEKYTVNTILWPSDKMEPITWKTSKRSVATISKGGKITACGLGTTVITATTKSGVTASIKVLVKLPKPANVKAVKYSSTKNYSKITWSKVDGAKGYNIYLCDWNGIIKKLGTTTTTSFIDKKINLNDYTYYAVQAYGINNIYDSECSDYAQILIPSSPTDLEVSNSMEGGAYISWESTNSYNISGYAIYRSNDKDGKYINIGKTMWDKEYTDRDIEKGKTYYYKVRSYVEGSNSSVYSNYTDPVKYSYK